GAGTLRVTRPFMVRVSPTVGESSVTETLGTDTTTCARALLNPAAVARMDALPVIPEGVTAKVAVVPFAGTSTLFGTVATLVSVIARLTCSPPAGAGLPSVTVIIPGAKVVTLSGFGVSVMIVVPADMVTVEGL